MTAILYATITLTLLCILQTRRIGWGHWQFYAVNSLIAAAAAVGRFV